MGQEIARGNVEGTGAAINVSLGFIPRAVLAVNVDDAGALHPIVLWIEGMGDAYGIKLLASAFAYLSSLGISEYAGDASNEAGFTIGADTDLNVSGETIFYIALR